ncbi:beta/alpha barrel domain-containing protein [Roseicella aquatilis]|nr:hydroxymethylglutaryl-CoA lyase [Roseicella aquatilis]
MSDAPSAAEMEEIAAGRAPQEPGVVLCECFAQEGVRQEASAVPAEARIALIGRIAECGFRRIEVAGFTESRQAEAEAMLRGLRRCPGLRVRAACPDLQVMQRVLAAREGGWGPDEVTLSVSASEGHSQQAFGRSRAERWAEVAEMLALAGDAFTLTGIIDAAFDCPRDGPTPQERVLEDAQRLAELGVTRIAIGDTFGSATPPRVRDLIGWLHGALPTATFIARFGDGRGTGIANTLAAVEAGLTHADGALGGAGGSAAGLASTEDLATALEAMGYATGLDLAALRAAGLEAERLLGRRLASRVIRADSQD